MERVAQLTSWCAFCAVLLLCSVLLQTAPSTGRREGFAPVARFQLMDPAGVLVINLDRRKDRLTHFRHSYSWTDMARTLPLHRVPAVEGSTLDLTKLLTDSAMENMKDFLQTKMRKEHSQLTPGGVGCYMSHVKCWEYIAQQNRPYIVCEDDALLPRDFGEKVQEALNRVPTTRPETVLLFHVLCDPSYWDKLKCVSLGTNMYRADQFWSLACYYITPEAAKVLLRKVMPISIQIDHALSEWGREGLVDNLAYPIARTWDRGDTDIQAPLRGA